MFPHLHSSIFPICTAPFFPICTAPFSPFAQPHFPHLHSSIFPICTVLHPLLDLGMILISQVSRGLAELSFFVLAGWSFLSVFFVNLSSAECNALVVVCWPPFVQIKGGQYTDHAENVDRAENLQN